MKLAIVCHPTYGGSGVIASELGMSMAQRGHEVHFVSYQVPFRVDRSQRNVHFHEVEVTSYPLFRYPPYALALATKLVSVVRTHGVRLIHAHYAIPHAISANLTKSMCCDCGIRTVTTLHGTDITIVGSDHSFAEVTRFGILGSDGVTAVSADLARETREVFDIEREVEVIPNFVDTTLYNPTRRDESLRSRFVEPGEALVVHISNFRPVKRVPDVIATFDRIRSEYPARLLMVGTGPDRTAAEEEAARRGISDRVHFVGGVPGTSELLAGCDLMLLPSENESFGLVALEAMACGVPVVATARGGLPEVVVHGETGFLTEVGDVEAMATHSLDLLADSSRHSEFAAAARERAVSAFDRDRVVDRYESYYRSILDA
ncbi:MAG: N-acetyl-alpha-D-glucosaminyl L-malate synthase BshA [Planctomycetota bacterium]